MTYNGKTFDMPFIRRYLGVPVDQAHIDLRYVLASLGYRGGLKECERQMGLDRGELEEVDGYFAVLLWRHYVQHSDRRTLETLLAYNALDVINLEQLMVRAYNLKIAGTPAGDTKQRSVIAAQRLFPGVSLLPTERSRKASDGLADALLLASYGQRQAARVWDAADGGPTE